MKEFKQVRDLAVYIRDALDSYAGKELPSEFKAEFLEYCNHPVYKKKIFSGTEFTLGFEAVLRKKRLVMLREILKEANFN